MGAERKQEHKLILVVYEYNPSGIVDVLYLYYVISCERDATCGVL